MTTTCDLSVDWNRCAYCSELRDRVQSASDLRLACSQRLDQAWEEYRAERERGNVAFGTATHRAWQARIDNLDRQLLAADAAAGEAIDVWAASIHEHHRRYEARQQEAEDGTGVAADTEEMALLAADTGDAAASACDDLDGDGEPLYLCGGFLNAQAERHATVERHETEEDDVLRDAVRAIEHGEATQIRAWGFGNRQGRRTALRELRELLDDMIADIDADTEEGAQ